MANGGDFVQGQFADNFIWGVATASYQIEGGWNADGKGENVWDRFSHTEGKIDDGSTGDVACNSYHKFAVDVEMIKKLNCNHYRFSLSWSRLLPTGDSSSPNPDGVAYYNKLIDELLKNGIKPCVTLYHWDLPQCLQDQGGWLSDDIVAKFGNYADFCFEQFGDRVKLWITINEPHVNCGLGYGKGDHAPGIADPLKGMYQASRTMLLSHATAWRLYDSKYRAKQCGMVSITLNSDWAEPKHPDKDEDRRAADDYLQGTLGWFAHPIYVNGDFPEVMKKAIGEKSAAQGLSESRLPSFSEDEKQLIKGTHDFFGLNHYTSRLVEPVNESTQNMRVHPDFDLVALPDPQWDRAGSLWLYIAPFGMRRLLGYIAKHYGNPKIIITENGCSTKHMPNDGSDVVQLDDKQRCDYVKAYINEALKAVLLDDVDLRGYFLWSLMDNFEWKTGYTERFGLHHVDFNDPDRKRTPRKSVAVYRQIIEQNGFKN